MEKYYIATEESNLYRDYFDYKNNLKKVNELAIMFMNQNGIETNKYYASDDSFAIVPTKTDAVKFAHVLRMPQENDVQFFKKNSSLTKAWVQMLKDAKMSVLSRPHLIFYGKTFGGRYRNRLFDLNEVIYCSMEPGFEETPKGFLEIKASEFFKVIEDSEKVMK